MNRNLDGIYFRIKRNGKFENVYFSDMTEDYTAVVVSNHTGDIYLRDVFEVPELTGIQHGASFVKHQLDAESTEIFTDKLKAEEVLQDAYINWCKINARKGETRNEQADSRCKMELQTFLRWNFEKKGNER